MLDRFPGGAFTTGGALVKLFPLLIIAKEALLSPRDGGYEGSGDWPYWLPPYLIGADLTDDTDPVDGTRRIWGIYCEDIALSAGVIEPVEGVRLNWFAGGLDEIDVEGSLCEICCGGAF